MPAKSMMVLPIMKAMKPAMKPALALFAKRDQLQACVPMEAKVPTMAVMAVATLISALGTDAFMASKPPADCAASMGMYMTSRSSAGMAT